VILKLFKDHNLTVKVSFIFILCNSHDSAHVTIVAKATDTLALGSISWLFYPEILLRIKLKVNSSIKCIAAFTNDFTLGIIISRFLR
jgi:hypothetical protein